ncbi:MAG: tRNA (guanosine(37)-N1)-methyltransferase TrmD [bacterium]|nr:tRNA (guanosine(37)-N1)-methyltransferase TrmD [bacterium]
MNFHVVTLFPEVVGAYCNASILGRAQKNKKLKVKTYQLRDFVTNKWGKADERPYGGGPGMVLQAEPIIKAVESIQKSISKRGLRRKTKIIITAVGGKQLTNAYAKNLAKRYKDVIIVCGRYEGLDARVKKVLKARGFLVDEVSTGPYILTGGEVPALAIIDATARQIYGVLGKFESLEEGRVASSDVYTRPEILIYHNKKYAVPKILLSGHHANIDKLRSKKRSNPH